jgi:hypothetical protein
MLCHNYKLEINHLLIMYYLQTDLQYSQIISLFHFQKRYHIYYYHLSSKLIYHGDIVWSILGIG